MTPPRKNYCHIFMSSEIFGQVLHWTATYVDGIFPSIGELIMGKSCCKTGLPLSQYHLTSIEHWRQTKTYVCEIIHSISEYNNGPISSS